jgi:hypothetical protein
MSEEGGGLTVYWLPRCFGSLSGMGEPSGLGGGGGGGGEVGRVGGKIFILNK